MIHQGARRVVAGLAACLWALGACVSAPAAPKLTVFAASSLADAFDEIAGAFEARHPGVAVVVNTGSSGQLAAQLVEGAPADVFASASASALGPLLDAGLAAGTARIFATNRLAIIMPAGNPAAVKGLADLAKPGVRLALAAPGVPIRDYADQALDAASQDPAFGAGFGEAARANIVSEEDNVRQIVAKVALGEADAGIVYVTDVTPDLASRIMMVEIPDRFNVTAAYPIVALRASPQADLAALFVDFTLSPDGQAILAKWGFGPAPAE